MRNLINATSKEDLAFYRSEMRRQFTCAGTNCKTDDVPEGAVPSLRKLMPAGKYIGAEFMSNVMFSTTSRHDSAEYRRVHTSQYSLSGTYCGWGSTEQRRGSFTMAACVAAVTYAAAAGQLFRGTNLCWDNPLFNPSWLEELPADQKPAALKEHIHGVVTAMERAGPVYAWDVVNEAANPQGTGLKNGTWSNPSSGIGPEYIDLAFNITRGVSQAKLFYNDYGWIEGGAKADWIIGMVRGMQQRGVPIDGLGFQTHLKLSLIDNVTELGKRVHASIGRAAALGLEVHITEMDVACDVAGCNPPSAELLQKQADVYAAVLRGCLAHDACRSMETWGFTDAYSWLDRCVAARI